MIQDTNHILVATQTAYAAIQAVLTLAWTSASDTRREDTRTDRPLAADLHGGHYPPAIAPVTVVHDPQLLEDEMGAGCLECITRTRIPYLSGYALPVTESAW